MSDLLLGSVLVQQKNTMIFNGKLSVTSLLTLASLLRHGSNTLFLYFHEYI
jgi:hypothetical protein